MPTVGVAVLSECQQYPKCSLKVVLNGCIHQGVLTAITNNFNISVVQRGEGLFFPQAKSNTDISDQEALVHDLPLRHTSGKDRASHRSPAVVGALDRVRDGT